MYRLVVICILADMAGFGNRETNGFALMYFWFYMLQFSF